MKNVCPCCKRALPQAKCDGQSKELMKDLRKAEYAIDCLESALQWPGESESFRVAVQEELLRMNRALTDHRLLWAIYQRNSKTPCYAMAEREQVAA